MLTAAKQETTDRAAFLLSYLALECYPSCWTNLLTLIPAVQREKFKRCGQWWMEVNQGETA
jgi:hypothetical protein